MSPQVSEKKTQEVAKQHLVKDTYCSLGKKKNKKAMHASQGSVHC